MKTKLITVCMAIFYCCTLFSQPLTDSQKQAIMAKKVAFITNELQLTPTEAQTFWPVYNLYQAEIDAVRKNRAAELLTVKQDSISNLSNADIQKLIDNEFTLQQQELEIKKKYFDGEFEKVLTLQKVVKLYRAEQLFKIYLLKESQNKTPGTTPGGK